MLCLPFNLCDFYHTFVSCMESEPYDIVGDGSLDHYEPAVSGSLTFRVVRYA